MLQYALEFVPYWEIKRAIYSILQHIIVVLFVFLEHGDKEIVMRKVWSNPVVGALLPNTLKCSNDSIIERKLLSKLVQSLFEVK